MTADLLILIACAGATVAAVRFPMIRGIEIVCAELKLSSKAKGQIIGYATSTPEFVVVLSAAFAGVSNAGFWNIASSNIINWMLFMAAVLVYRQELDLVRPRFLDEVGFGLLSVAAPLVLLKLRIEMTLGVCIGLLAFFAAYRVIDSLMNPVRREALGEARAPAGGLLRGLILIVLGVAVVVMAGRLLGNSAYKLIREIGMPAWLVGWVLGFITSIPELTSFFVIFRLHKKRETLHLAHDTQEALDALVSSNMCNLGVILPLGVILYALLG